MIKVLKSFKNAIKTLEKKLTLSLYWIFILADQDLFAKLDVSSKSEFAKLAIDCIFLSVEVLLQNSAYSNRRGESAFFTLTFNFLIVLKIAIF